MNDGRPITVRIYPAADVPGQWVAEIPECNIMSQGNDRWHALAMIAEAAKMVADDEAEHETDPFERGGAESADSLLHAIVTSTTPADFEARFADALESKAFGDVEFDLTRNTLEAARAALFAKQSVIATLALCLLLRDKGGHEKPVAKWLTMESVASAVGVLSFNAAFDPASLNAYPSVRDLPLVDLAKDRADFEATEAKWRAMKPQDQLSIDELPEWDGDAS